LGALQRARATLDERAPAGGRERALLPGSTRERELVGWFATAVEQGDTKGLISLLTDGVADNAARPYDYQGPEAIAGFIHQRGELRGKLRLTPTRANGQPAFGWYLPDPQRPDGAHDRRGQGVGDHLVRRAQLAGALWTAEDAPRVASLRTSGPRG
jgi:RNA polymerase sigma-70 factor (ECF subfamily)